MSKNQKHSTGDTKCRHWRRHWRWRGCETQGDITGEDGTNWQRQEGQQRLHTHTDTHTHTQTRGSGTGEGKEWKDTGRRENHAGGGTERQDATQFHDKPRSKRTWPLHARTKTENPIRREMHSLMLSITAHYVHTKAWKQKVKGWIPTSENLVCCGNFLIIHIKPCDKC